MAMRLALFLAVLSAACLFGEPTLLDRGYGQMYNLQFQEAHRSFQQWEQANPASAIGPVSDAAAYLFSEFERLHILEAEFFTDDDNFRSSQKLRPDPQARAGFEQALEKTRQLADHKLAQSPGDRDATFANVLRLGLHADYQALIEKKDAAALDEMKAGRVLAQQLVAADPGYYDAYLAIGVENYLLSQKIAPLRWFLRITGAQTDKEEGIRNLRVTAEKGHYLQPYARLLLAVSDLRDGDRAGAAAILKDLAREYPGNRLYAQELSKITARTGRAS